MSESSIPSDYLYQCVKLFGILSTLVVEFLDEIIF